MKPELPEHDKGRFPETLGLCEFAREIDSFLLTQYTHVLRIIRMD